jgi:hypothetical protein
VFATALFFALAGRTVHVLFEHAHDKVCGESVTHFHEVEHACFICEFDFQVSDAFMAAQADPGKAVSEIRLFSEPASPVFSSNYFIDAIRGPPVA